MTDTTPALDARYRAMLLARTGEDRLRMAASMYTTARALVIASVLAERRPATSTSLRQRLFERFYGHEFDAPTRARILSRLGASSPED